MIKIRTASERGYDDKGWLQSRHTFSFDTYYDADFLGYRHLRVINENWIRGGKGFGFHSQKDVEIVTYVIDGVLEYQDNRGNSCVVRPGEVQRVCAGSGIEMREVNLSHHVPVHFLQIWINPNLYSLEPSYGKRIFSSASKWGQWRLICSGNGREGSLSVHQDADLYSTILDEGDWQIFDAFADRYYWLQVVAGKFAFDDSVIEAGDGAAVSEVNQITIHCLAAGELLLFDLS